MAHFSCPQCMYTVRDPVCPSCNRFLTEDVAVAEACMRPLKWELPKRIAWCTAFGHWGDVFCCVGVMKSLMAQTRQKKVNVLYVGPDLSIVDWLEAQEFIGEVRGIKSSDVEFYRQFWGATSKPGCVPEVWLGMLHDQMRGLPKPELFVQTHINASWFETKLGLPAQMWYGAKLQSEADYAGRKLMFEHVGELRGAVYHLHPVSTMSERTQNHWPHWLAAIEWLIEKTPHRYVLTGLNEIPFLPKSPRLINLIGKTQNNMEVLAISDCCTGVISTPNSVALWSVIQKQRCLCIGNLATQHLSSYYRRFLQRGEQLTYLNVDCSFSGFQAAACEFLSA